MGITAKRTWHVVKVNRLDGGPPASSLGET